MSNLLAARSQMALSLGFHIVFAVAGIGMPLLMAYSEWLWLRTGQSEYLNLAKRWAKGTAIFFAVGAVSGTVLSFELGLLWPEFMRYAGAIIGMPFSLEGFAFFTEAIFLGLYLYGWKRLPPKWHLAAGAVVSFSGVVSGIFVVTANAWMNAPAGFEMVRGHATNIRPIAAMLNPAALSQTLHMTIASYLATGAAVVAVHALRLLREGGAQSAFDLAALRVALPVTIAAALLQPLSGDFSARNLAERQPEKLAALEGQFETETHAPLRIGGIPDTRTERTRFALEIPGLLSFLSTGEWDGEIKGLKHFPPWDRPNPLLVHIAFQIMVASGVALLAVHAVALFSWIRRKRIAPSRRLLKALALVGPLGFLAVEAGWFVTELGRQPWIIYRVMRTSEALTPMPALVVPFGVITVVYLFLGLVVVSLMKWQIFERTSDAG
ncbi:MAG: cytochrome ubiquinol oxidase subunit I [Verrucomicrobiae bacterium]|nr:cytochrome ubiquinol oxidase subunit I [Verrucomicrobiae bacterium]